MLASRHTHTTCAAAAAAAAAATPHVGPGDPAEACPPQIELYFLQDASELRQPLNLRNEAAAVSLLLVHWGSQPAAAGEWRHSDCWFGCVPPRSVHAPLLHESLPR